MRINLRQVEAFRAVFQTGSMTAAGALMGVTQPAISRLIRDLEAEIRLPLFDRKAGKVTVTPDGVALYREVQRSFHGLDRIARAASELGGRRQGDLRIVSSVGPSFYGLPPVLGRFREAWPGVRLSLRSFPSPEVLDAVAMRQADLGVAVVSDEAPGVEIEPLPGPNAVCVLPAGHPLGIHATIRPHHLADVPMLMISDYSLLQQRIMQRFEAADIRLNIVGDSPYSAPICALVAEGIGVSVVDALTAWAYEGRGVVVRPFEPAVPYELKVIYPAGQPRTERVTALVALLHQHLQVLAERSLAPGDDSKSSGRYPAGRRPSEGSRSRRRSSRKGRSGG